MGNVIATLAIFVVALSAILFIAIFGYQRKPIEEELSDEIKKRHEITDGHIKSVRESGSTLIHSMDNPITAVQKVNMELLILNNENMKKLESSIERFDTSSTRLASVIMILTIIMLLLVSFQVWLMVKQV